MSIPKCSEYGDVGDQTNVNGVRFLFESNNNLPPLGNSVCTVDSTIYLICGCAQVNTEPC